MEFTKDEVFKIVKPYSDRITQVIQIGHDNYFQNTLPVDLLEHTPTAKANVIHCKIKTQCKKIFGVDASVEVVENGNDFYTIFENCIIIKFKKLSKSLRVGNVPTKIVKKYQAQEQLDMFPTVQSAIHLYAGYVPDEFGRKIEKIYLTCPSEYGNKWVIQLNKDEYSESLIELPIEVPTQPITKRVRARVKTEGVKDGTTDN